MLDLLITLNRITPNLSIYTMRYIVVLFTGMVIMLLIIVFIELNDKSHTPAGKQKRMTELNSTPLKRRIS